jgi:hypothetical protein
MLTRARGGSTSSLNTPYASNLGFSTECLTPQRRKTQVFSSKRGGSSSSSSNSRLVSHGSSQGGYR